jgi:hypothetical protein
MTQFNKGFFQLKLISYLDRYALFALRAFGFLITKT